MSYVAYRSGSQAMLDLVADRIQVLVLSLASMLAPVSEGRIRLLAVASRQRAPLMSGLPTVAEAGFPDLTVDAVIGLFGWRGMPVVTRERLAAEAISSLREPAATERLHEGGLLPSPGGASEMAGVISAQKTRVEAALRILGPRAQ
jgi:tripartite-type tricarboxylate transporter receptor subunit TctC